MEMSKRDNVIAFIAIVALFSLLIGGIQIYRHVQERVRVARMERMNRSIERILTVVESEGIHAIGDIASMIDEDVSLREAEKTRLKERFFWATFRLGSSGGHFRTEEGPTYDSRVFIHLTAIEQRLGIPPAQALRYLLVEFEEENGYPDERWQIMDFVIDEGREGTFLYDVSTFYQANFDSIQAQLPEIDLCPEDYSRMRTLPLPVVEEAIRQFLRAE